jgi:type II secretory pathway pseudopilin PulG
MKIHSKFTPPWRGKQNKENRAFTLVETLVAISIFTVSLLGIMSVLASGISNTNYAKQKIVATYLAQEGIECIRNTRDNYVLYPGHTWVDFKNNLDFTTIPCPSIDPNSGFARVLYQDRTILSLSLDEVKIISDVSWTQPSGTYHITFSENLFNWVE